MVIPESALLLAGFVLAHAMWSISDVSELLVPLAILERNGKREVLRFEGDTQEEAISNGKATMAALGADVEQWAFAREGLLNEHGDRVDVVSIDIGTKGSTTKITLIQRFEPYSKRHHFLLIGDPEIVIDGTVQESAKMKGLLETVHHGVSQHAKAGLLWDGWHRP